MNNIKGIAVVTDGNQKRIAITWDVINDEGVVTAQNKKVNRVVTNSDVIESLSVVGDFAQKIVDELKE